MFFLSVGLMFLLRLAQPLLELVKLPGQSQSLLWAPQ